MLISTADRLLPGGGPLAADQRYDLVLVGGVPGAGKSTAIARATDHLDHVRSLDPEHVSWWLRRHLPAGTPYRRYRWLIHLLHTARVLVHLLEGPVAGRQLVVHDPGTRVRRRQLFLTLARCAGWRPILLYVDVNRLAAQDGQRRRGRVVRSFDEHWQNWQALRPFLLETTVAEPVLLVNRQQAVAELERLCRSAEPRRTTGAPGPGLRDLAGHELTAADLAA